LFNFEAKFWNTIIPLLIKPGKVSRDYIDGKRQRYTNPFRFYLTVSIVFFLIVGLYKTVQKYEALADGTSKKITTAQKKDSLSKKPKELTPQDIDSIKNVINKKMDKSIIPIPKKAREEILNEIDKKAKDSTLLKSENKNNERVNVNFGGKTRLDVFLNYLDKNPEPDIDIALDSLGYEKNFTNRFLFTKAESLYSFSESEDTREQFFNQLLSYGSVALFIFLPFFTLFLKFYYIRRKFTYVDHLIFVFHVQTVFFMLFAFHFIFLIFHIEPKLWIFTVLFLIYLYLAMKKFYQQGYFKTFLKFVLLNISFGFISMIGITLLFIVSFAFF
jgi:hypothetical protein